MLINKSMPARVADPTKWEHQIAGRGGVLLPSFKGCSGWAVVNIREAASGVSRRKDLPMFLKLALGLALTAGAALPIASSAEAAVADGVISSHSPADQIAPVEKAQYVWGGQNYCWYDGGWHGPGWYRCGYAYRNGLGWGGAYGWNGWHGGYRAGYGVHGGYAYHGGHYGYHHGQYHGGGRYHGGGHYHGGGSSSRGGPSWWRRRPSSRRRPSWRWPPPPLIVRPVILAFATALEATPAGAFPAGKL